MNRSYIEENVKWNIASRETKIEQVYVMELFFLGTKFSIVLLLKGTNEKIPYKQN